MSLATKQPRPGEEGSAYIVTLLVLLVLTVLGLSLALITQSELQIGANEKTIHRTFYGADSGIAISFARLDAHDTDHINKFEIKDADPNPLNLRLRIDACLPIIVDVGHANLSAINERGASGKTPSKRLSFGVTSEAIRIAGTRADADKSSFGRRTISMIGDLSPQSPDTKLATGSTNEECVNRMKL